MGKDAPSPEQVADEAEDFIYGGLDDLFGLDSEAGKAMAGGGSAAYNAKETETPPPSQAVASNVGLVRTSDRLKRLRSTRSLTTSGQGALDQPSTASAVLLGV